MAEATRAEQDAVFQRLMDLGRGFQPDLYDVAGEVVTMLREAAASAPLKQPTREQIAEALHNHQMEHAWRQHCREDVCIEIFNDRAEVVLALLNGSAKPSER